MKKKISLILVLGFIISMLNFGSVFADTLTLNEKIDNIFSEQAKMLIDNLGVTSLQYAVMDNGKIIANGDAGVYSKAENKILDENAMYGIGSTSKMFVTVAAMKLYEMGKLDIDKPIINYLPEFEMADERYKDITVRMLMNHSSGLYGSTFANAFLYGDNDTFSHDQLLEKLKTQSLKANPGEFSVYCNDGFTLLEILVEKVSQMKFTDFIHKYITEPLNLNNTKTPSDDFDNKMIARMYDAGSVKELPIENVNVYGTGGIYSTASDLCKFSTIFTSNTGVLSEKSVKMMEESEAKKGIWKESDDSSVEYGLGWDSVNLFPFDDYNIKALVKNGDTIYYHSTLLVLPEYDLSVALVSSGGVSTYNQMIATNILLEVLKDKKVIDEAKPLKSFVVPEVKPIPENLSKYMGTYATTNNYFILKTTEDNKLSMTCPSIPDYPELLLIYDKDNSFISEDGSIKLTIVKESNGNTYIYIDQYSTIPLLGQTSASLYFAQKLEENKVSEDVLKIWQKRHYKSYLLVSEKNTSISYSSLPVANIALFDFAPGYLLGSKIVDENKAVNVIQMPVLNGRDTSDYEFFMKNGIEYLTMSGSVYASVDMLTPIFAGTNAKCTIQSDGYARWYVIDETSANKSIKVDTINGGFVIYNAMGACIYNSAIDKNIEEVKLPLGGYITFIASPQTQFNITIFK